ncbi:MAG: membrane lipoprotein lipid attachment site-containing protein [Verrucomicrobiaceae bacterium]|nr:membrane lipoprotein lipid attachment site-containing protein [Verrucomicrobiaceae bacterium]
MKRLIFLISAAALSGCSSQKAWEPKSYDEQQYWKRILAPREYLRDIDPHGQQYPAYKMSGGRG